MNTYQRLLQEHLEANNISGECNLLEATEIDPYYEHLVTGLKCVSDKCVPTTSYKPHLRPFWSSQLKTLHVEQKRLRAIWVNEGRPRGCTHLSYVNYKQAKRAFSKQYKADTWRYEQEQFAKAASDMETDPKLLWRYIHNHKNREDNYHIITDGINNYVQPQEQSVMWRNHFKTILNESNEEFERFDTDWKCVVDDYVNSTLTISDISVDPEGMDLSEFTPEELDNMMCVLPKRKASGIDLVTYEHLRYGGSALTKCIARLFNSIVKHARVPFGFKQGLIVPLYKGGKKPKNNNNSYRGITLLPVINKLFEKCIHNRVIKKLSRMQFPPELQFAGKKGVNSLMTSFSVQELIRHHTENKGKVFAAFMDMEKCFDKIWWNGLLYKLHKLGVTDRLWLLIRNWYMESSCVILTNGIYSESFPISRSIRQGGVLSMLMMAAAFSDLHTSLDPHHNLGLTYHTSYLGSPAFADDVVIMSNTMKGLQTMIDNTHTYANRWRLTFSSEKSKCLVFGENTNNTQRVFNMGDEQLPEVTSITHVGVELTTNYTTANRTNNMCNKTNGILASLSVAGVRPNGLNPIVNNILWNRVGLPSLLYGSEVWYDISRTDMLRMEKAQVRKMKRLQGLPWRTHDYVVRSLLKQLSVQCMIDIRKLNFLHHLISSKGVTNDIFINRLYDSLIDKCSTGFIPDVSVILKKYGLDSYLLTYARGGDFPQKKCWKAIVKDNVLQYEQEKCIETLTQRNDVHRYVRIMGNGLYTKSFPFYRAAMKNIKYVKLIKLAKLVTLPTVTVGTCTLCDSPFTDIVQHVIMNCSDLMTTRDRMWDDIMNTFEVDDFVDLWGRPDPDILDVLLGAKWRPLSDTQTREQLYDILCRYADTYFKAVQNNLKWLK